MSPRRLAWVLGVVAAVCVMGTSAVALTHRDDATSAATTGHWRRTDADTAVAYRDAAGNATVVVRAPWVYDEGWCDRAEDSSRAFAGVVPLAGRRLPALARRWADAITIDLTTGGPAGPVRLRATRGRVDADLVAPPGPCNPPREHLTVVAAGADALVLVRDVGVPGALDPAAADRFLAGLLRHR